MVIGAEFYDNVSHELFAEESICDPKFESSNPASAGTGRM
jgi:hypothetical protein